MKKLLLFGSMLLSHGLLLAQDRNDAFVYIQGDKQTPIYIKMEGEMQARYSKNFVILNGLAAGPLHLEVLFQQNAYPTQKFILNIPASSQRSLVLKKIDNTKFALYDLNSGHYINAGNQLEDDVMTDPNKDLQEMVAVNTPEVTTTPVTEPVPASSDAPLPDFPSEKPRKKPKATKPKKEKPVKEAEVLTETPATEETAPVVVTEPAPVPKDERFLSFEMQQQQAAAQNEHNNRRKNRREENRDNDNNAQADVPATTEAPAKPNRSGSANCAEAMTDVAFDDFMQQLKNRTDEETRLAYIMKYGKNYCFSTQQVWVTASTFSSQSSRYEVARVLKPKVIDVDQYELLLKLFNTNYLKQRFAKEVIGQ